MNSYLPSVPVIVVAITSPLLFVKVIIAPGSGLLNVSVTLPEIEALSDAVGDEVGEPVGDAVGDAVGLAVAAGVGLAFGDPVGAGVGLALGEALGIWLLTGRSLGIGVRTGGTVPSPTQSARYVTAPDPARFTFNCETFFKLIRTVCTELSP
jgi:hypothetical protein